MSSQANEENVQILLTTLIRDRFCSAEASDLDACIQNFVPTQIDSSYIDQSLQRRGLAKCVPYQTVARKCLENPNHQTAVMKASSRAPTCRQELRVLEKCRRNGNRDCDQEALELVFCGLAYLVHQRHKGDKNPVE